MAGELTRALFSEGVTTTKPTNLVPNTPDGLQTVSIDDTDSPITLVVNRRYFADTTSGTIAATMPVGASTGDRIQIVDNGNEFDTNAMTVSAGVGDTINSAASDELKKEGEVVEYVYDSTGTNWVKLAFGSGGGLTNDGVQRTAAFTADAQNEYFLKTDAGAFQVELPPISAGAKVRLIDSTGFWSTNPPTVVDNGGTGFNGVVGSPLELDVPGSWIEFSANIDDSQWEIMGPNAIDETLQVDYQERTLSSDLTDADSGVAIGDLAVSGLEIGTLYKLHVGCHLVDTNGTGSSVSILNGGTQITALQLDSNNTTIDREARPGRSIIFEATDTTISVMPTIGTGSFIRGNGTTGETYLQLETIRSLQTQSAIPVVTPWQSFTPTWNNLTFSTSEAYYRRVGDSIELNVNAVLNAAPSGDINFSLPFGLVGDTSKSHGTSLPGHVRAFDTSGSASHDGGISLFSGNIYFNGDDGLNGFWDAVAPFAWASGDVIGFDATVPVVGWEVNAVVGEIGEATSTESGLLSRYEEETGTLDGDFTGGTYKAVRIGDTVTVSLFGPVNAVSDSDVNSSIAVGANFRPQYDAYSTIGILSANITTIGVRSTGTIRMLTQDSSFALAAQTSAVNYVMSITYNV